MKLRDKSGKIPVSINEDLFAEDPDLLLKSHHIEKDRLLDLMNRALHELSADQKRCVTLFYLDRISYQEIAAITGFSLMQVKSNIQNGKRNLKIYLDEKIKKQEIDK